MDKDEFKKMLKENLKLDLSTSWNGFQSDLTVDVYFDDELIYTSSVSLE